MAPVTFRYRIFPHGEYNVVNANRFGMEQAQPLVHIMTNTDPKTAPLIAFDNNRVFATILKSSTDGKSFILRLRSLSGKDETVKLSWPFCRPKLLNICEIEEISARNISNEVTVPANGIVTLKVVW